MRSRTTGLVALGAGVFFLVFAVLLRFYAAPSLAVMPKDYWSHYIATGTGTALDPRTGKSESDVPLSQSVTIKGETSPKDGPSDSVVWDYVTGLSFKSSTNPCPNDVCSLDYSSERVAFDHHTGLSRTSWAGDKVDNGPVSNGVQQKHVGYISKFPFDTQKKDYALWDGFTGTAPPAHYVGTEKIQGLTTYKFVQTIGTPTQPVHAYDRTDVPPSLVGDLAPTGTKVPVYYYSEVTAWVDPVSGIPVAGTQKVRITLGATDGSDPSRLVVLQSDGDGLKLDKIQVTDSNDVPKFDANGNPVMTDYVTQSVRDAKNADRISLVKTTLPLIGLIAGLLLLAVGAVLILRGGRSATAAPAPEQSTVKADD